MCGRYTLTSAPEAIRALFHYDDRPNFPARYNIAPTQPIPIVRLVDGKRQFALVRWGLLPSWVKDPKGFSLLINARGETAVDKPAFRAAMKRRRCLIPADGFYEWKAYGDRKQPFYIHAKNGEPLALAGLWETWIGPNGEEVDTAAIVTTEANPTLSDIHDRMPVIVPPAAFDQWLGAGVLASGADAKLDLDHAMALMKPAPDDLLEAYPVSTQVNRVANDNPKLLDLFDVSGAPEPAAKPARKATRGKKPSPEKAPAGEANAKKDGGQGVLF